MSDAQNKKHKLLLEYLISDREVFVKCVRIAKASYFEAPLDRAMEFVLEFFDKHHNIPKMDIIEAETGILLKERVLDESDIDYFLDEFETHCRNAAMTEAVLAAVDCINDDNVNAIEALVRQALMVRLDNALGTDIFDDPQSRIENMKKTVDERCINIGELDQLINKIRRGEMGVFFASTSGGKSVMLANVADKLASQGLNVLIVSLELNEELYTKRLDTVLTGFDIAHHAEKAADIAEKLKQMSESYGRITTKKMPFGTSPSDIRAIVMEYHLKYGVYPDALVVDYLGLMGGVRGKNMNKFDEDEIKAFGLRDLGVDFEMYVFTAGQINRDGYDIVNLGPNHVAGGISVVNACDWAVGLVATEEDIDNNQVQGVQMKVRNGGKTTKPITLYRCPKTLRMSGKPFTSIKASTPLKTTQPKNEVPTGGKAKLQAALSQGRKK